jgi:hypothetical protein
VVAVVVAGREMESEDGTWWTLVLKVQWIRVEYQSEEWEVNLGDSLKSLHRFPRFNVLSNPPT